jgi:Secretion system C-terminal sorting domain
LVTFESQFIKKMKKILFSITAIALALHVSAQGVSDVVNPQRNAISISQSGPTNLAPHGKVQNKKTRGFGNYSKTVGFTTYDLQTNASMSRRIVNHGNGSISLVWTLSNAAENNTISTPGAWADRGTGYNFTNAATPWALAPFIKIEPTNTRTGFCNLMANGTNEFITNHNAGAKSSFVWKNSSFGNINFGTTPFASLFTALPSDTVIWPKTANAGDHLYVVGTNSNANDTATTAFFFSYSPDGGVTWPKKCIQMPGITHGQLWNTSADSYNIDARDSFVSVVVGGLTSNLYCIRSSDYGNTWRSDTVLGNGLADGNPLDQTTFYPGNPNDSLCIGTDGSAGVYIDEAGKTHVTYSPAFWILNQVQADSNKFWRKESAKTYSYYTTRARFPFQHWVDGDVAILDSLVDCDQDGSFGLGANHYANNTTTAYSKSARYGAFGTNNQGQITGKGNDIYVVYSAIVDNDTTDANNSLNLVGQNYRDIFVMHSGDGGLTFSNRVNLSNSPGVEDVFPTVAKLVDGAIHVAWQSDNEPGTVLTNGDGYDVGNTIQYLKMSVDTIKKYAVSGERICQDAAFGPTPDAISNVDKNGNPLFTITPNPATNVAVVNGNIADNTITVVNAMGQIMDVNTIARSQTTLKLNIASLPNGVYYVNIGNATNRATTRFVKQ